MRFPSWTFSRLIEFIIAAAMAMAGSLPAFALEVHRFDIPEEAASAAIRDFGAQAHVQILVAGENVKGKQLHAVRGSLSTEDALNALLADSGLAHKYVADGSIALLSTQDADPQGAASGAAQATSTEKGGEESPGSFLLAQATPGQATGAVSVDQQSQEGSKERRVELQEVIVTAQKKEERLQDVPVPVTVLNTESLADTNQVRLTDYVSSVPGLQIAPSVGGAQALSIRGITAGYDPNPTVGVMIDGVPYGPAAGADEITPPPDIDPGDLARIEVLRGPQGTLFGADSMGGLVNFVTADPSTDRYSGRLEAGINHVQNGSELGYNFRASANIPLGDTFAVRVSGFDRHDPGYIDNVLTGQTGVNASETEGGRLSALWTPSNTVSLKVNALYQDSRSNGVSDVDTVNEFTGRPLAWLQQSYIPGTGEWDRIIQAYSGTFNVKLGDIELTSLTGYNDIRWHDDHDYSSVFGGFSAFYFPGFTGAPTFDPSDYKKFTEELRLSGSLWHAVDWLVGGFYTHEHDDPNGVFVYAADPTTGQITDTGPNKGLALGLNLPQTYTEYAAFADLTYHFTDQFDVQVGARESRYNLSVGQTDSGASYGPTPIVEPVQKADADAFTYLLTPRFKISPDLMVYARFASGFRPGGSNCPGVCTGLQAGSPATYGPDKTYNYELGVKGDFLDHQLSIDGSLYYIDWKDMQVSELGKTLSYQTNGNSAKSEGVELSVQLRPITGLKIAGWVTYDNAVLTEAFPSNSTVYGAAGDRLPNSARWSGNLSAEQDFHIAGDLSGFVGAQTSYVGDRLGVFTGVPDSPAPRQDFPSYTKTDLRAGVRYDTWTASVYVNNVADRHGLLGGGIGSYLPIAYYYIQPRTIGLNVVRSF
jgi:iron complex outermembrane receptor protein